MPSENMVFSPRSELLSLEEMIQLVGVFEHLGIDKIRITGGEPFMRKNILHFFERLHQSEQIKNWYITTNGVLMLPHVAKLKELGVSGVNLSLDTLKSDRFLSLTKRDDFQKVWSAFESLIDHGIQVKINAVIQKGINEDELIDMALLAKEYPVQVRFIEFMPFNGGLFDQNDFISEKAMIETLSEKLSLTPIQREFGDTSQQFHSEGFQGTVGTIAAFTRNFCGSCNRLRIDAKGQLRNCLYGQSKDTLKGLLRSGASNSDIAKAILGEVKAKPKDGFEAEKQQTDYKDIHESMSTIGG